MTYDAAYQTLLDMTRIRTTDYMTNRTDPSLFLVRTRHLLDYLGGPDLSIPHYIHVTGTSGKGSTSFLIYHILHAAGRRVGLTVSPHPTTIRERYHACGETMTEDEFAHIITHLAPRIDKYTHEFPDYAPSFFELTIIIAFIFFERKHIDHAVLEVGCGGRYDATNAIEHKDIAIITNIGLDHTQILGETKEAIAREKAGIMRRDAPTLSTERDPHIREVIREEAVAYGSPLTFVESNYACLEETLTGTTFRYDGYEWTIPLIGEHQVQNATLAIRAAYRLGISRTAIDRGLQAAVLPLRFEIVSRDPLIILDSAHNEDKLRSTLRTLTRLRGDRSVHLLCGFTDKPHLGALLEMIKDHPWGSITITKHDHNPYRTPVEPAVVAAEFADKTGAPVRSFEDAMDALTHAKSMRSGNDILLITGSTYLSGELRGRF